MAAVGPRPHAGLPAAALPHALGAVADPPASVVATGQGLVARQAAGNVLQVTGDVAALLVLSHAPFLGEVGAGGALLFTVAVVKHCMLTLVSSRADVLAFWGLCATSDGRVQHSEATVARQLIEAGLPAGVTVSTMASLLAAVEATAQLVAADHEALVLNIHATQLATLVPAAGAFLVAAPLTSKDQLGLCLDCSTRNLHGLGATSASDSGGQGAGPAASFMAQLLTQMNRVAGATGQRFAARLPAGGDRIRAALALAVAQLHEFGQRRLAAGTRLHQAGRARAGLTLAAVAELLAAVSSAVQHLSACFFTAEVSRPVECISIRAA